MSREYTLEMAVDLQIPTGLQLSPDAKQVAFCTNPIGHRETQPTSAIFVVNADGSSVPRPITGREHNNTSPQWSPDGQTLAFRSDRAKRGEAQLHVVSSHGGEALRLTELPGGADQATWHPDGRRLAFTARRTSLAGDKPASSDIVVGNERWKPRAIATVAATGGAPVVVGPAEGHVWGFAYSPDGSQIAAIISKTEDLVELFKSTQLILMDADGGSERILANLSGFPGQPLWSADGTRLAFVGSMPGAVHDTRVCVVDVASGDLTRLDDHGRTPNWVSWQGDSLLVHSVERQRTRVDRTNVTGESWEPVSLGAPAEDAWIDSRIPAHVVGDTAVWAIARYDRPADLFAGPIGAEPTRLTELSPQLNSISFSPMEEIHWNASDGTVIDGWLLLPPNADPNGKYPLIAEVHGGPSTQWGNWFYGTWHDWAQILAAQGYAVLLPNPRGSTGRGVDFTDANRYDFGGGDFDDVMTGIDYLTDRGVADGDRLGICGWSFGGFMTTWAVAHTDRFKAAVAGAAPTNWISKIGTTDIRPGNEWNLGEVNTEPEKPWQASPIRYVGNVKTPTLLLQGGADVRVPPGQSWEFYNALVALGVDTDLAVYPRQGHAFHERAHQLDLLQRLTAWFEKHL